MRIQLWAIMKIESDGDPTAINSRTGATGLFQITQTCLADFNLFSKRGRIFWEEIDKPVHNLAVAEWFLTERIPYLLRASNFAETIDSILACYNWGIGNMKRKGLDKMPEETRNYIAKYKALVQ